MFIGNSNISLFFPELTSSSGETESVKWLGAIKVTDFPTHPAFEYLLELRKLSSEDFFITLGTHDIIQICRTLNDDLQDQIERYQILYLKLFQMLNSYGPTHLMLFPLPLDTIWINNLTIQQRQNVVLKFNQGISEVLKKNKIIVIYPQEQLFNNYSRVKPFYLHVDDLHLNAKARAIYLNQIQDFCHLSYTSKPSLEKFTYSKEIDVFVYLWLSDCQIPHIIQKTLTNSNQKTNITFEHITCDNFFNSLHSEYSQSTSNDKNIFKNDQKIMRLNQSYVQELEKTIERVLPNHHHYGVVFFWQGLWSFQRGDIEQAINLLKRSINKSLRIPFHDSERVESYIKFWNQDHTNCLNN